MALAGVLFWWRRRGQHARPMLDIDDKPELEHMAGDIGSPPVAPYTLTTANASGAKGVPPPTTDALNVTGPGGFASEEGQTTNTSAQPEEISALMGLRRLVNNIMQEHTSPSAPPAYGV